MSADIDYEYRKEGKSIGRLEKENLPPNFGQLILRSNALRCFAVP
jgi:hypothetical protein